MRHPSEWWCPEHPEETQQIYDRISLRLFMRSFSDLHPIANTFQRNIVIGLADEIIEIILETK